MSEIETGVENGDLDAIAIEIARRHLAGVEVPCRTSRCRGNIGERRAAGKVAEILRYHLRGAQYAPQIVGRIDLRREHEIFRIDRMRGAVVGQEGGGGDTIDRKSTRLTPATLIY